jgi:Lon protease-like protein
MTRHRIPLFPLPGVVLLPGALLPLHIFEPRYRAMVAEALAAERTIGMAMIRAGSEFLAPTPEILPVGGAGRIVESEELPDGRYNIVLEGRFRYRIVAEFPPAPYRVADVEELPPIPFPDAEQAFAASARLRLLFGEIAAAMAMPPLPAGELDPERLASEVALRLRFDPAELQAFLEADSIPSRFEALFDRIREWRGRVEFLAPFRMAEADPSTN